MTDATTTRHPGDCPCWYCHPTYCQCSDCTGDTSWLGHHPGDCLCAYCTVDAIEPLYPEMRGEPDEIE